MCKLKKLSNDKKKAGAEGEAEDEEAAAAGSDGDEEAGPVWAETGGAGPKAGGDGEATRGPGRLCVWGGGGALWVETGTRTRHTTALHESSWSALWLRCYGFVVPVVAPYLYTLTSIAEG